MKTSKLWKTYINKNVKLIISDIPFPRKKEGIIKDVDDTHVFLEMSENKTQPILRIDIKRVELIE